MDFTQTIRDFLAGLEPRAATVGEDESLLESGILDSMRMLDLLGFLEKTFEIEVEDDELMPDNFDSISAMVRFLGVKGCCKA